jgi:Flp pilus assembly pilin Flp
MRLPLVRRGISSIQWVVIAAVITLAVMATIPLLGGRTSNKLDQTATDVSDPAKLTKRFGS